MEWLWLLLLLWPLAGLIGWAWSNYLDFAEDPVGHCEAYSSAHTPIFIGAFSICLLLGPITLAAAISEFRASRLSCRWGLRFWR